MTKQVPTAEKTRTIGSQQAKEENSQPFFGPAQQWQSGAARPATFFRPTVQPKLTINEPGDQYEQEADAMAEQVMRMPAGQKEEEKQTFQTQSSPISSLQRKCDACEEEETVQRQDDEEEEQLQTKTLMRKAADGGYNASPQLSSQLSGSKGNGQPLPNQTLGAMNQAFGADFSKVRIHTGSQAAEMSQGIQAKAFTHGADIYFNQGQYNPESTEGKRLLAHELTHTVQQQNGAKRLARSDYSVGKSAVHVDYGNVVFVDKITQYQNEIELRYSSLTGEAATAIKAQVAALSDKQKRWLLYAIDLLSDNPLPALHKKTAVQRLLEYAPKAQFEPLTGYDYRNPVFNYENEVLRVSGWFEHSLTAKLKKPSSEEQQLLDFAYNHAGGSSSASTAGGSSCPTTRSKPLDEKQLRNDLPPQVRTFLNQQVTALNNKGINTQNANDILPISDLVQQEALKVFAPYIGRGRMPDYIPNWKYSSNVSASTAPGAIAPDVGKAFLANRANGLATGNGLFRLVGYDPRCSADTVIFDDIIEQLSQEATVQSDLAAILSWQSFTARDADKANVVVNLQYFSNVDECTARWRKVITLCHELLHVYVHPEFYALNKGRRIITEGFTEVLGNQLYETIRARAQNNAAYRAKFEGGLSANACKGIAIPASTTGYGDDGLFASKIRGMVGDDRFRAAYFLGKNLLAGLRPKLQQGSQDEPHEREADRLADQVVNTVQRQPSEPEPAGPMPAVSPDIPASDTDEPPQATDAPLIADEEIVVTGTAPPTIPDDKSNPPVKNPQWVFKQNKAYWALYELYKINPLRDYDPINTPKAYANRIYQAQKFLRLNKYVFHEKKIALDGILGPETILFLHYILQNENFSAAHFELTGLGFDQQALSSAAAKIIAQSAEVDQFPLKFLQEWKVETKAEAALDHIADYGDLQQWYDQLIFGGLVPKNIQNQEITLGDRQAILLKAYADWTFSGLAALVEIDRDFLHARKDSLTLVKRHKKSLDNLFWIAYAADTASAAKRFDSWFSVNYPNDKVRELRKAVGTKKPKGGLVGLLMPFFLPKLTPEEQMRLQITASEYFREKAENIDNFIVPKAEIILSLIRDTDTWREIRASKVESELMGFFGHTDVFEKFADYLVSKGNFEEFIQGVEQLRSVSVLNLVVQFCMQTTYQNHPAVIQAHERLTKLKRDIRSHDYVGGDAANQAVILEKEPDRKLKVGEVAGGSYIISEDKQRMKPDRQKALEDKMRALIMADIGDKMAKESIDGAELSQEKYMEQILEKAAQELKIGKGDFEEVTYQEGYRLLGVKSVIAHGVEEFLVNYEKVFRIDSGNWETLEASSGYRSSRAFEESLGWFKFANQMESLETLIGGVAIVVGSIVLLASGAGGALVALGGGAKIVALSIGISVLIWAITADHLTIEGFLHAVLDGYLMAVGFRFFSPIGKGVASLIGTATFKQKLVGLILQSVVTGGGAGAFTGPASMLISDVLQGKLGQRNISDYLQAAKTGFLLGAMFELGGSFILGPLMRTAGKNVLERIANIEQWKALMLKSKVVLKPGEWASEITKAYAGCKNWLVLNMESSIENLIAKKIQQQAVALLESYTEGLLLTIHRQTLDLIEAGMTKESVKTLEKIITRSHKTLPIGEANTLVNDFLNELAKKPAGRVNQFFSLVNVADDASFQAMLNKGMKELASADAILQLTSVYPPNTIRSIWQHHFENDAAAFTGWIQQSAKLAKASQQDIFRLLAERGGSVSPAILLQMAQKNIAFSPKVMDGLVRLTAQAKRLNQPLSKIESILASMPEDQIERFLTTMRDIPVKEFDKLAQSMLHDPINAGKKVLLHQDPGAVPMASDAFDWFLGQTKVKAALASNAKLKRLLEQNREAVYELMQHEPIRSHLVENPKIVESLIKHPEARKLLGDVLSELKTKGAPKVVQELRTMPKLISSLSPAQKNLSESFASAVKSKHPNKPAQEGFDLAQKNNPAYLESYLDDLYRKAREAAKELERKVNDLAAKTDGAPSMRKDEAGQLSVKGRDRAVQKIKDEYGNDASKLVDIAGGKIVYNTFDDLYRALEIIKKEFGDNIVMFKDRFATPLGSGYQDILMNVKMSNGHIAEFRMHLKSFDIAAESEHALYEVSRVVAPDAIAQAGLLSLEQEAIMLLIRKKTNDLYAKVVQDLMTP